MKDKHLRLPDFQIVDDHELACICKYHYKHLDTYLRTSRDSPRYDWHRSNVTGEMYEHLVYEKLRRWASETEGIREFVLKGPYIARNQAVKDGFVYDPNHEIYYNSGGETIAEFDALFKYGNTRCFVEISNADTEGAIKSLRLGVPRKYNLLRLLFPQDDVYCWIITSYKGNIDVRGFPVKVIRTPKYQLDPGVLGQVENSSTPMPASTGNNTIVYQLKYKPFDYFKALRQIHSQLRNTKREQFNAYLREQFTPYIGLIERVFLGRLSAKDLQTLLENLGYNSVDRKLNLSSAYIALKLGVPFSVKKIIYLRAWNGSYYELSNLMSMKIRRIPKSKRSIRDIDYLDRSLTWLDVEQAEAYITSH